MWDAMNPPVEPDGQAYVDKDKQGRLWVACPWCATRNFLIRPTTQIKDLPYKCKGSKCKREFEVNYGF